MTIASLLSILVLLFHLTDNIGAFFFVWTLLALGLSGTFSVILSVRGLWSLRSGQHRRAA